MQIDSISGSYGYGNTVGGMSGLSGTGGLNGSPPLANKKLSDLDANGDGSISETEFEQALAGITPAGGTSGASSLGTAQADNLFKRIDANGDGKISSDEWDAFQQKIQGRHHHHHHSHGSGNADNSLDSAQSLQNFVSKLYKSADTDGNGQLSQSELTNWLSGSVATA